LSCLTASHSATSQKAVEAIHRGRLRSMDPIFFYGIQPDFETTSLYLNKAHVGVRNLS